MTSPSPAATPRWTKCDSCGQVYETIWGHGKCPKRIIPTPTPRTDADRHLARVQVAKYRTTDKGADYTKKYRKAKELAVKRLITAHKQEFETIMLVARREVGLD